MRTLRQEFEFAEAKKQILTIQASKRVTKMYKQLAKDMAKELEQLPKDSPFISNSIKQMYLENYITAIDSEIDKLTQEIGVTTKADMEKISEIVVKANKDWMNQFGMDTTKAFSTVPTDVVNYILSGDIYKGNWNFSNAIWGNNRKTKDDLREIIAKGVAAQKPTYDIAKDLEKYVNPSAKKDWEWSKVYPGTSKKVDYNAQRLARTMIQHTYQQTLRATCKDNPFVDGFIWRSAFTERTCELCMDRDGLFFKTGSEPLDHPNGLCWLEPAMNKSMNEIADELADWVHGSSNPALDKWAKSIDVPRSMKQPKGTWRNSTNRNITNSIDKRFSHLAKKYPVQNVRSYGDLGLIEQNEWDLSFNENLQAYMLKNKGINEKDAKKVVLNMMTKRPTVNDISSYVEGNYNPATKSIRINTKNSLFENSMEDVYRKRKEHFYKQSQRIQEGKKERSLSGIVENGETALMHEYGHAISEQFELKANKQMVNLFNSMSEDERALKLSLYGSDDIEEFIAEGFAESQLDDARELSKQILKIIEDEYKKKS